MENKKVTTKPKSSTRSKSIVHMDPSVCPGQDYFSRKEKKEEERLTKIITEALGDVPRYMRMAGSNRIWLWLLTLLSIIDTAMIVTMIIELQKT